MKVFLNYFVLMQQYKTQIYCFNLILSQIRNGKSIQLNTNNVVFMHHATQAHKHLLVFVKPVLRKLSLPN